MRARRIHCLSLEICTIIWDIHASIYWGTVPKYCAHPSCYVSDFVLGVGDFDLPLLVLTNSEFMDSDVSGGLRNIVQVVKSRRMRWAGRVAHMGEDRGVHRVLVGKPKGNR
jgi:hypothetical protein